MARWIAGGVALCILLGAGAARAELVHYMHPHPLPPSVGQGMCHIEGPHVHAFGPSKPMLYIKVDGAYAFIGDPVEFAPKAPKYAYYGHHPVFWVEDDPAEVHHYCYITGPHYHLYAPPPELKFKAKGGVYWYVGAPPRWYRERYRRHRAIDRYYARVELARPVVTVEPPEGFVGVYIGAGGHARVHGHVHGGVHVVPPSPPGIDVNIRVPGVGVVLGGGGPRYRHRVVVGGPRHRVRYRVKHRGHGRIKVKHRGGRIKIKRHKGRRR